jgi:hypothetical protein
MSKNYDWGRAPKEICCFQRRNGTLAIESELSATNQEDNEHPLNLHGHYSRYHFALINSDKKVVTANVPVRELPAIFSKAGFAARKDHEMVLDKAMTATASDEAEKELSPAYTVVLKLGLAKGKTPAEALLTMPNGEEALNKTYTLLQARLKQYPGNKVYMDAIKDASRLKKSGQLSAEDVVQQHPLEGKVFTLYRTEPRPLTRRKNADGKCFCYEVVISWRFGQSQPVAVTIENYYAPVVTAQDGRLTVTSSAKVDSVKGSFAMTESEWEYARYLMEENMKLFESSIFQRAWKKAVDTERANKAQFQNQSNE